MLGVTEFITAFKLHLLHSVFIYSVQHTVVHVQKRRVKLLSCALHVQVAS